jgi:hypothetical protein
METRKKGIIIFVIFLLVIGILYIKSLPPSTDEIDGKYLFYTKSTFDGNYTYTSDYKFEKGTITFFAKNGRTVEGNFKVIDNENIEVQFENNVTKLLIYKINRNDKNEVISLTEDDYIFERVNE